MRLRKYKKALLKMAAVFIVVLVFFGTSFVSAQENLIPAIKFKDVDIKIVLESISQKATKDGKNVNIVVSPDVIGTVSVNLEDVDWFTALEAIIRPYNYGYEWIGNNIVLVDTMEKISQREAQAKERQEVEPVRTKVYQLKYIDASDAKKAIETMVSPMGRISILEVTGQAGWEFGTDIAKRTRARESKVSRTKIMLVSDISKKLDEIDALLDKIDVEPKQILIKTKIMEVGQDVLRDIGFDYGTGSTGADDADTFVFTPADKKNGIDLAQIASHVVLPTPAGSGAKTAGLTENAFKVIYQKLTGTQFEVIFHALEEDGRVNTLSAPVILTLNNQEASILVGDKFPIIKTEISTETSRITGGSLDYYQDIGIQLNVVPQIAGENEEFISMIVHPAVTSQDGTVDVKASANDTPIVSYPKLTTREAETQVIIRDGETIAIGGLLKDVRTDYDIGIPFLKDLPYIGQFFKRTTHDTEKIDLLIFITAKIVKPGELIAEEFMGTAAVTSRFEEEK
ncbi:MAG: hypothetical protein PHU64_03165 [Candidatus Omnitrophica bacterium]|nr:hypothetical protein [Candidatus Omnitrophota bacterium]MDD5429964.1 hypothetical protein [Candidatus Omnitrophota bacterium]